MKEIFRWSQLASAIGFDRDMAEHIQERAAALAARAEPNSAVDEPKRKSLPAR